jgi:hypothetical protein
VLGAGTLTATEPEIVLRLEIVNRPAIEPIVGVSLRCQIRIESARRRYTAAEQERLRDLIGEPERWGQTLRPLLWANLSVRVAGFTGSTEIDLPVPRRLEPEEAAGKYFDALEDGSAEITLLFSGVVFYEAGERLQVSPIPWTTEARYAFPVGVWRAAA